MDTIAATVSPKSAVAKRVVSHVLLTMFAITAVTSVTSHFPSASGLLFFLWPMSTLVLACYWLRLVLNEHDYLEDTASISSRPSPYSGALNLTSSFLMRA